MKMTMILCAAQQAKINESIRTLKLEVDMVVRQVKGSMADKEKALVDHDVMKLVGVLWASMPLSMVIWSLAEGDGGPRHHEAGGCAVGLHASINGNMVSSRRHWWTTAS